MVNGFLFISFFFLQLGDFAVSKRIGFFDPTAEKGDSKECFCGQLQKLPRMMD